MKKSASISTVAIAALFAVQSCRQPKVAVALTVMHDITDTMASRPDTASLLRCFDILKADPYAGAGFRCVPITDIVHNRAVEEGIRPECKLLSNPLDRAARAGAFTRKVAEAVIRLWGMPVGRQSSSVLKAVQSEAMLLAEGDAERRILVVYSDLRENGLVNLHTRAGLEMLMSQRDSIRERLEREVPDMNLSGVEIRLVYEARDYADSEAFSAMAQIYEEIFERRGAKVFVGAGFNP